MCWDTENPFRLAIVTRHGQSVRWLQLGFDYTVSVVPQLHTVAMIDSATVQLTPLAKMIVPPPMSGMFNQTLIVAWVVSGNCSFTCASYGRSMHC